jgi:hypothetical protein
LLLLLLLLLLLRRNRSSSVSSLKRTAMFCHQQTSSSTNNRKAHTNSNECFRDTNWYLLAIATTAGNDLPNPNYKTLILHRYQKSAYGNDGQSVGNVWPMAMGTLVPKCGPGLGY